MHVLKLPALPPVLPRLKLARAFLRLLRDPEATENAFAIIDNLHADATLRERFPLDPAMQRVVDEPFRQDFPDLDEMARLPAGTLGHALAVHMGRLGVDFAEFDRPHHDDTELDRITRHGEETHDLWHVVTGFGTGVAGEIGLQAFYLAQTRGLPALVLLTLGVMRLYIDGARAVEPMLDAITRGWQMGRRAEPLFGIDWRSHLERPLDEVRAELNVDALRPNEIEEVVDLAA